MNHWEIIARQLWTNSFVLNTIVLFIFYHCTHCPSKLAVQAPLVPGTAQQMKYSVQSRSIRMLIKGVQIAVSGFGFIWVLIRTWLVVVLLTSGTRLIWTGLDNDYKTEIKLVPECIFTESVTQTTLAWNEI